MKRILLAFVVFGALLTVLSADEPIVQSRYALELGDQFNTPDGMAVDCQGNIILAVPNAYAREGGTWLLKITPDEKVEKYFWLKPHPQTNKACPLGIVFGSDGHLYICDAQGIGGDTTHKSRILRVVHQNGKPVSEETLVTGLVQANGIAFANSNIYFTETQFVEEIKESPIESGVFCFSLNEFRNLHRPIQVGPNGNDRHCIFKFKTENPDWPIGANGIGATPDGGFVYVANFGDKQIIELTLDKIGYKVLSSRVCVEGGPIESVDGLRVCPKGYIFFADFAGNAVHVANPANGKVFVLAKDPMGGTGAGGELDCVSEVCLRGSKLYCSNIDLPYCGNKNDQPHTLSVLDLEGIDFDELLK
ncbi:MAG: SMP-30/gluconolactonase/LRE family protein [Planctomycetaceae bacterium]|nr:SMP-30/gluconolactonase/LRE family protein [Planctomycetaceae bacterium]